MFLVGGSAVAVMVRATQVLVGRPIWESCDLRVGVCLRLLAVLELTPVALVLTLVIVSRRAWLHWTAKAVAPSLSLKQMLVVMVVDTALDLGCGIVDGARHLLLFLFLPLPVRRGVLLLHHPHRRKMDDVWCWNRRSGEGSVDEAEDLHCCVWIAVVELR
jgi:hypothetical protein